MGFSRQDYCSGLPCSPSADLPNPGTGWFPTHLCGVSCSGDRFSTTSPTWEAQRMLISSICWGFSSVKSSKILLCISLEGEPGPYPKATLLSFDCPSNPLPPLISNCLNPPFGTQGRSQRWNEAYFLQSKKTCVGGWNALGTERLLCPGALQGPAQFPYPQSTLNRPENLNN